MSISQSIVFEGQVSSPEDVRDLRTAGFVHITGLVHYSRNGMKQQYRVGENLQEDEKGIYHSNNGMMVVITTGGEVWLRSRQDKEPSKEMLNRICPNQGSAYVFLSNADTIDVHDILDRVANPYCGLSIPHSAG
jgi:hypothetical protein